MENDLISVIVPIYNVEKYLPYCIDSIVEQTYKNLEIILIDDGSSDNCGKICDDYAKKDKRIRVIHKKNEGIAITRNRGLDEAKGKYIFFVDSDDSIIKETIKYLYTLEQKYNADIAIGQSNVIYEENLTKSLEKNTDKEDDKDIVKTYNTEQAIEAMLYNTEFTNNVWNKLYKKETFFDVRFPEKKIYEDLAVAYKILANAKTVVLGNKRTYNYLTNRKNSIMNTNFSQERMQGLKFAEDMVEYISIEYPEIRKAAISRLYMECIFILLKIPNNKEYRQANKKIKTILRKYRFTVVLDKKMPKKQKLLCIATMFGRLPLKMVWKLKENYKKHK